MPSEFVDARTKRRTAAKVRPAFQKCLIRGQIPGIGLLDGDGCPGRDGIGDVRERLAVTGAEVEDVAFGGQVLPDGAPQQRDEQITLIGAHHQHPPQRIWLQHPREGVVVLLMRIEAVELVAHDLQRVVQLWAQLWG
ncbi:MAG: hypothetical protein U0S13_08875 [Mycobacterium sp.]